MADLEREVLCDFSPNAGRHAPERFRLRRPRNHSGACEPDGCDQTYVPHRTIIGPVASLVQLSLIRRSVRGEQALHALPPRMPAVASCRLACCAEYSLAVTGELG